MREALAARPDDDFTISAPVRRRSAVKKKPKTPSPGARLLSLALQHPRRILGTLLLGGCGSYIAWNALVLQTAHHPAPLFNQSALAPQVTQPMPPTRPAAPAQEPHSPFAVQPMATQAPTSLPAATPAAPPAAAPKLPSRSAITDLIRSGGEPGAITQPVARTAPQPAPAPVPARAPTVRDPIGEIIRMGGPVPTPPANVGASDVVMTGQRALAKLGYGIKADGIMGPGTRQAIERFEQDRKLPVTGEFSARTARELSAASGIAVQ